MQDKKNPKKNLLRNKQKQLNSYVKYSGLAVQIITIVIAGVFVGKWIDSKLQLEKPFATVFSTVFFIIAALYHLIKTVRK